LQHASPVPAGEKRRGLALKQEANHTLKNFKENVVEKHQNAIH